MDINKDYVELGYISEELMRPVTNVLVANDWNKPEFTRFEKTLVGGKLVVLPYLIAHPNQLKYTEDQQKLVDAIYPIIDEIMKQFPGYVKVRGELATLMPGVKIKLHYDDRWFHQNCRRIHVPVFTNDKCEQIFEDRSYHLDYCKVYEINNRILHSAANFGETLRIHLILDLLSEELYNSIDKSLSKLNELVVPEQFKSKE